ncbi:MAG: serine/threonine-protein kinase, partial [Bradymonadaceae bacterium]
GESMHIKFAVFVAVRIAEALHTAHTLEDESGDQTPVVHRDVSPDNILISSHGNPQLADFGVAQLATELQQKQNQPVRGKASFLSPEALQPDLGPVDGRSDIFSLGTVLYQALTGEAPFEREGRDQTLKAILLDAPPVPSARRPEVPEQLDAIVKQSLAKKPDERFQSAREFQNALEEALQAIGIVSERRFGEWIDELVDRAARIEENADSSRSAG